LVAELLLSSTGSHFGAAGVQPSSAARPITRGLDADV
jgi:hypothetical protein